MSTPFTVQGNRLLAQADLYWEEQEAFSRACQELLRCPSEELIVDLSRVNFVFSTYIGILSNFSRAASEQGKHVELRVSRRIEWVFQLAGLKVLMKIEVVH